MNKNESRYFGTARRMDEALIALLEKKDLEYITVREICAAAEVNRSTFYLHYETIQDLLSEALEYLKQQFFGYFDESAEEVIAAIADTPLDRLVFVRDKYLVPYLRYIQENKTVFAAAYRQKQVLRSDEYFAGLYRHIIDPILGRFRVPEELRAYYNEFFMQGTLAVIRRWLKDGCRETPEKISEIIENLCTGNKNIS